LVLSSLYFATASGITCSNDGSHYALTRALAEEGRFTIESYDQYAEGNDVALYEDQLFSDRPPGTALIASAFYKIGTWLPAPLAHLESRHDAQNPRLLYVLLVPVWAGAGTVVLLYLLLRELDVSVFSALTTSCVFGLGTTHWKYSSVLFSHALSALLVMSSIYLVICMARMAQLRWVSTLALGFLVSYAVLVEYSNALVVAAVALYLFLTIKPSSAISRLRCAILFIAGGLLPAGFLAFYNAVSFGSPSALSYDYAINYPWAGQFRETFNFPLGQGLRGMLIWGRGDGWCNPTCYNQGLFLLSPVLLLSILGIGRYIRRARRQSILTLGLFLVYLGLFAKHRTFHGFTADGRYLTPFLALWCIPLAFHVENLLRWSERPAWQAIAYLVLYGTIFLSVHNILLHIGLSYNYELDLGQLSPMIAKPGNWSYVLGQVFRNAYNLPLLWLSEGLVLLLGLAGWWVHGRLTDPA
jgi:hypothetical protein